MGFFKKGYINYNILGDLLYKPFKNGDIYFQQKNTIEYFNIDINLVSLFHICHEFSKKICFLKYKNKVITNNNLAIIFNAKVVNENTSNYIYINKKIFYLEFDYNFLKFN